MSALWLTIPLGIAAAWMVWCHICDCNDDWASEQWRNRQTARKYAARFDRRYPR